MPREGNLPPQLLTKASTDENTQSMGLQPLHHDVLVSHCSMTAETTDGAILFVFGDEAAAAAHQTESPPKVEEPAQPKHKQAEPLEQLKSAAQSPPAAQEEASQPEAAYEKTRGKKVKEAVMEAKVKHGAEQSGVFSMLAEAVSRQASQQKTLGEQITHATVFMIILERNLRSEHAANFPSPRL